MKRLPAITLSLLLVLSLAFWAVSGLRTGSEQPEPLGRSVNLMDSVTAQSQPDEAVPEDASAAAADFALRLLRAGMSEGENTLISPLSVLCALAMTANGAEGETRRQMEAVLGMPVEELNAALRSWTAALPREESCRFSLSNAIWFTDDSRFSVSRDFLQVNADWYGAGAYRAPFDQGTCDEINAWVQERTGGMIDGILDRISEDAVMYLVNALAFDGQWAEPYERDQVQEASFTTEDGRSLPAELMWSTEDRFLRDEHAVGFLKAYKGYRYAFAALLPEEGMSLEDYAASLTGQGVIDLLEGAQHAGVRAALPKFTGDCQAELSGVLSALGMPLAFDAASADFSALGRSESGNIFISRVLHRTHIAVDELGTRAAAASAVEMADMGGFIGETEEVVLDRPFLYMIVDLETNVPVFIGTAAEL